MEISEKSKYQRWYDAIVESGRNRKIPAIYTEMHHIKPRSHGGGDDPSNLVRLTYREHFLVHWLLLKICEGKQLRQMQMAMFAMTNAHEKLASFLNYLIYLMVEHWPAYIIVCAGAAFIWVLIVAEPKAAEKRKLKARRLQVRS